MSRTSSSITASFISDTNTTKTSDSKTSRIHSNSNTKLQEEQLTNILNNNNKFNKSSGLIKLPQQFQSSTSAKSSFLDTRNKNMLAVAHPNKPTVTRRELYEQFWYKEYYNEYLRAVNKTDDLNTSTEYRDSFCHQNENQTEIENLNELIEKYPIYESVAITHWNPDGARIPHPFLKRCSMSKPISERYDIQFG